MRDPPMSELLRELAAERRAQKAERHAYWLRVIRDHLGEGWSTKAIATRLGVGPDTAKRLIREAKGMKP